MASDSKTAGRRAKQSEIWDSLIVITWLLCTFDLLVVILGSFYVLAPKLHVTQKWLSMERNEVKFGTWGG